MQTHKGGRVYNVMFPLWMLVWFPSWLWLLLIPANYLIDRIVLWWSLGQTEQRSTICRRHAWKVCLAGFAADFVGSLLLLGSMILADSLEGEWAYDIGWALSFNPFGNVWALLVAVAAVAVSACFIYVIDLRILRRAGLGELQARSSARWLAIFTAPYLFLFPSAALYR